MCPICGSPKEAFESYTVEVTPAAKSLIQSWRCLNCNYVHSGTEPPEVCPVCGATEDNIMKDFEKLSAECKKCGWKRVFDGSGKRTVPRKKKEKKAKTKSGTKGKTKSVKKDAAKGPTMDATKEYIKNNHKE